MNINYLTLRALYSYKSLSGSHQDRCESIYNKLRANIISNIVKTTNATGFLWEQYDDTSGDGIRGHPFTGWTALIVNIMAELY